MVHIGAAVAAVLTHAHYAAWSWWAQHTSRRRSSHTCDEPTPTPPLPFKPPSPFEEREARNHGEHSTPCTPSSNALKQHEREQDDSAAASAASPSGSSVASGAREAWKHVPEALVVGRAGKALQRPVLPAVAGEMVSNRDLREFVSAGASAGLAVCAAPMRFFFLCVSCVVVFLCVSCVVVLWCMHCTSAVHHAVFVVLCVFGHFHCPCIL